MNMFKSLDELIEELYEEFDGYSIDELMDELEGLAVKYQNDTESEHDDDTKIEDEFNIEIDIDGDCECDGDCKRCEFGNVDDSDEYENWDNSDDENDDEYDDVDRPFHYAGKIEVIDFIEDKNLDYNLGNCVKYISRAGKKHEAGMTIQEKTLEDLRKARWYLDREISTLEDEL